MASVVTASAADTFTLMTYNLLRFSFEDRDKDGQKDNFKPEEQIAPMMQLLQKKRPDVLAVQKLMKQERINDAIAAANTQIAAREAPVAPAAPEAPMAPVAPVTEVTPKIEVPTKPAAPKIRKLRM